MTFAASTTDAYVQLNAGADTLLASASLTQSTVWGGADGDSISLKGSSQSEIDGQAGNDTLNFAVGTYSQSTIRGGAGVTVSKTLVLSRLRLVPQSWVVTVLTLLLLTVPCCHV